MRCGWCRSFDPTGVAARDLQECLLLQLRHLGLEGTPTEKIVAEHLRLLQNHQVPEIARKLGLTIDDLKEHIEVIRQPRSEAGQPLQPDAVAVCHPRRLRHQGRGPVRRGAERRRPAADADQPGLPAAARQERAENNDETRAYVKDKFRSALWLIKSVEQRQKTIHKVANSIINFQRDFLDHGIEHLRPLVLRDVANDIGMHESTVSRVVTNKYMHTPQGVFEMSMLLPQRHQQLVRRERLVGHDQAAHPQDHRERRSAKAVERLEDRQHPAARRPDAGAADDREIPRRAEDSDIEPAQSALLTLRAACLSMITSCARDWLRAEAESNAISNSPADTSISPLRSGDSSTPSWPSWSGC